MSPIGARISLSSRPACEIVASPARYATLFRYTKQKPLWFTKPASGGRRRDRADRIVNSARNHLHDPDEPSETEVVVADVGTRLHDAAIT